MSALRLFRDPTEAVMHLPWMSEVKGSVGDIDLLPLLAMLPKGGYTPDFVTPPPDTPLPRIEDDLARVRATAPKQILKELAIFERRAGGRFPAPLKPLRENPRRELPKLVDAMAAFWERAMLPHWPRILALLSADLRHRAIQLTDLGPEGLLNDLHQRVDFDGDWLHVEQEWEGRVELDGRGLLLVPSAFTSPTRIWTIIDVEPWQPTLIYPARGVALLWQTKIEAPPELDALIGVTRARILQALDAPRSTTELAAMLDHTPGGISQHLKVLTEARLVAREREGRVVLYARTDRGDALLAA